MPTDRRTFVKGSGAAALVTMTGLAGCEGGLLGGGGGGEKNWQYDPGTLAQTQNRFFGSMNYGQLYELRDELPESSRDSFEMDEDSPVEPSEIDEMTGVGGAQVGLQDQSFEMFGTIGVIGSFDKSTIVDEIESDGEATEIGTYDGFTLYEDAGSSAGDVGSVSDGSATVAVGDGAMLVGVSGASGSSLSVTGEDSVKAMIDASNGNAALLEDESSHVAQLKDNLGGTSMEIGGEIDPDLLGQFNQTPSGSQYSQYTDGARAAGLGMDVGADTTTMTMMAVYTDASSVESTNLKETIEFFGQGASDEPGIESLSAEYRDNAVVVTLVADTQTMFEEGGAGSNFSVVPAGLQ